MALTTVVIFCSAFGGGVSLEYLSTILFGSCSEAIIAREVLGLFAGTLSVFKLTFLVLRFFLSSHYETLSTCKLVS